MDQTFTCILLLLSLSLAFGKYVYIEQEKTWYEAQQYCRTFYTDLAPVSNNYDIDQVCGLTSDINDYIWIGMQRSSTDREKWMWSGGGEVSTFFWEPEQPDNRLYEDYGLVKKCHLHDAFRGYKFPFLCYRVVVVREKKTWEEALDYCREHHHDLASVASDTEMLLIQKELGKNITTEHVWIGLHFFPARWLWVDRQPLVYEAWAQQNKPDCSDVKLQCVALHMMGETESNNRAHPTLVTPTGSVDVNQNVWMAHDCKDKLHFICY